MCIRDSYRDNNFKGNKATSKNTVEGTKAIYFSSITNNTQDRKETTVRSSTVTTYNQAKSYTYSKFFQKAPVESIESYFDLNEIKEFTTSVFSGESSYADTSFVGVGIAGGFGVSVTRTFGISKANTIYAATPLASLATYSSRKLGIVYILSLIHI